jgi:hypothetical protein
MTPNVLRFTSLLTNEYMDLFANNSDYTYAATRTTPDALAHKMTDGLKIGTANKDGIGIKRTCKSLSIKYTYAAISAYLNT